MENQKPEADEKAETPSLKINAVDLSPDIGQAGADAPEGNFKAFDFTTLRLDRDEAFGEHWRAIRENAEQARIDMLVAASRNTQVDDDAVIREGALDDARAYHRQTLRRVFTGATAGFALMLAVGVGVSLIGGDAPQTALEGQGDEALDTLTLAAGETAVPVAEPDPVPSSDRDAIASLAIATPVREPAATARVIAPPPIPAQVSAPDLSSPIPAPARSSGTLNPHPKAVVAALPEMNNPASGSGSAETAGDVSAEAQARLAPAPREAETPVPAAPVEAAAAAPKPAIPADGAAKVAPPKPAAPTVAAAKSAPPITSGNWVLQFGAFGNPENADKLKAALEDRIDPVRVEKGQSASGETLYFVWGGAFGDAESAKAAAARLKQVERIDSFVKSKPSHANG